MTAHEKKPPAVAAGEFDNIFITNGEGLFHLARDQDSGAGGAFTWLLADMAYLLRHVYGANEQFCLIIPHGEKPKGYKDYQDHVLLENHDGTDSVISEKVIAAREESSDILAQFLYHLRLAAAEIPGAAGLLIEKTAPGKFIIAAKDSRTLTYALGMLATQQGIETGLYPLSREGRRTHQVFASRADHRANPHVIGAIGAFTKTGAGETAALPKLPYSLQEIADIFNSGRQAVPTPPFRAAPLAESAPIMH